eukprot:1162150-Pelagomonas_calceolata.AAC.9
MLAGLHSSLVQLVSHYFSSPSAMAWRNGVQVLTERLPCKNNSGPTVHAHKYETRPMFTKAC